MYSFALSSPTMAIQYGDKGKGVAVIIPGGSKVAIADLPEANTLSDASKLIEVEWNGRTVRMFLLDLLERGDRVECAGG